MHVCVCAVNCKRTTVCEYTTPSRVTSRNFVIMVYTWQRIDMKGKLERTKKYWDLQAKLFLNRSFTCIMMQILDLTFGKWVTWSVARKMDWFSVIIFFAIWYCDISLVVSIFRYAINECFHSSRILCKFLVLGSRLWLSALILACFSVHCHINTVSISWHEQFTWLIPVPQDESPVSYSLSKIEKLKENMFPGFIPEIIWKLTTITHVGR